MAIPEKDFYTLDEIIQRWRFAAIDHVTLLKLATEDLLVFSIYVRDLGSHTVTRETPQGIVTTKNTVGPIFRSSGYSRPPLQYLKADDARRILESRPGERIAVQGHYSIPERTKESGLGYLQDMHAPLIAREDLLVSRAERDRFERLHKIPLAPPWRIRAWRWLSDQATHRVFTMLSGWIVAFISAAWTAWLWWYQLPRDVRPITLTPSIEKASPDEKPAIATSDRKR